MLPPLDVAPVTVAERVLPPHSAAIPDAVTLTMLVPDRLSSMATPSESHWATALDPEASELLADPSEAATAKGARAAVIAMAMRVAATLF